MAPVSTNQMLPSGCVTMARGCGSSPGIGNSLTAPSVVMRPTRLPAASLNQSAPSRTTIDKGLLPGEMPVLNSVIFPAGVMRPIWPASVSENQMLPSGPSAMPSGPAFAVGTANSSSAPAGRHAADLVGLLLCEPQIAVAAERDADRRCAGRRQGKFFEGALTRIEAADLGRAALAEPQIAIRPLDADIGRAIGARNPMFADEHRVRRAAARGRCSGIR